MDVVVTIPKSEYNNDDLETKDTTDEGYSQFWTFKRLPANLDIGDRVYFIKNSVVESSMRVFDIQKDSQEQCATTGRNWSGNLVYMNDLRYENLNMKVKGFQGFRYKWW